MKTPPQQATGYQKEDDPEPTRSKLRGIAPKEIECHLSAIFKRFKCQTMYRIAVKIHLTAAFLQNNPTTTFVVDLSDLSPYAAPVYHPFDQERAHVTSLSDRRRRICDSHF